MNTLTTNKLEDVHEAFFHRVVEDPDFFSYNNVSEQEALELAKDRSQEYFDESVAYIKLNCEPEIGFLYDSTTGLLSDQITDVELQMFADIMFERFLMKDFAKLKIKNRFFIEDDIKMFSPANDRKTFSEMVKDLKANNKSLIRSYGSRDRLTGKLKSYNGTSYGN